MYRIPGQPICWPYSASPESEDDGSSPLSPPIRHNGSRAAVAKSASSTSAKSTNAKTKSTIPYNGNRAPVAKSASSTNAKAKSALPEIQQAGYSHEWGPRDRRQSPGSSSDGEPDIPRIQTLPPPPTSTSMDSRGHESQLSLTATAVADAEIVDGVDENDELASDSDAEDSDAEDTRPKAYKVDFRNTAKGFDVREDPLTFEQELAVRVNESFAEVLFKINFKRKGDAHAHLVNRSVLNWTQQSDLKRDPRKITNVERRAMKKQRRDLEKKKMLGLSVSIYLYKIRWWY